MSPEEHTRVPQVERKRRGFGAKVLTCAKPDGGMAAGGKSSAWLKSGQEGGEVERLVQKKLGRKLRRERSGMS